MAHQTIQMLRGFGCIWSRMGFRNTLLTNCHKYFPNNETMFAFQVDQSSLIFYFSLPEAILFGWKKGCLTVPFTFLSRVLKNERCKTSLYPHTNYRCSWIDDKFIVERPSFLLKRLGLWYPFVCTKCNFSRKTEQWCLKKNRSFFFCEVFGRQFWFGNESNCTLELQYQRMLQVKVFSRKYNIEKVLHSLRNTGFPFFFFFSRLELA